MKHSVRSDAGFSLIELMTVVGIVGIVAMVAVPQFYKFQARARQSEAKGLLSSIFTAQKSFHAEWNMYTASARNIGVGIEGTKSRYDGLPGSAVNPSPVGGAPTELVVTASASTALFPGFVQGTPAPVGGAIPTTNTFMASVYGDPNSAPVPNGNGDQWSIDQLKSVVHDINGVF